MQLALRGGLGFVDTGGGITPANWASQCCWPVVGVNPFSSDCYNFATANHVAFGEQAPCSSAGINFLTSPSATQLSPVAPPVTPIPGYNIDTTAKPGAALYGQAAYVLKLTCPAAVSPCPCDGRLVQTDQDAKDLLTCQAIQQQLLEQAQVSTYFGAQGAADCAAQAAECESSFFSAFVKPSADCTGCSFDASRPASLFLIGGLILFGLALTKGIIR
jgi:hypothetical protein